MGLDVLARIIAAILKDWPPNHVVEISTAFGWPLIIDTSVPRNTVAFLPTTYHL